MVEKEAVAKTLGKGRQGTIIGELPAWRAACTPVLARKWGEITRTGMIGGVRFCWKSFGGPG
jgi:hypothetical protein